MNKLKFVLVGVLPILFTSCTNLNQSGNNILQPELGSNNIPIAQASNKVANGKGTLKGWEYAVTKVKSEGRIIKENYTTYEAADAWTVVSVSIKNTSGKRQKREDALANVVFSKLIDSRGNEYQTPQIKFNYNNSDLNSKPFSVGETRSFDLLFDTPQGIKAKQLYLGLGISEDDSLRIKL